MDNWTENSNTSAETEFRAKNSTSLFCPQAEINEKAVALKYGIALMLQSVH